MSPQDPTWLREAAIALVARVHASGMTITVDAAEALLADRHIAVAAQLGVTERSARRYLDDAALDDLAQRLVADFTDEAPGADIFTLPRTSTITVTSYGRLIAGLAEAIQFYQRYTAIDDGDRSARIHELAQMLSLAGLLQSESDGATISAPPALFHRVARTLETVAELTPGNGLAQALADDSARARAAAPPPPHLHGV